MDTTKRKNKKTLAHNNIMASKTKEFLQKICYKETARVDMTKYGFVKDSKVFSMQICIQPLLQQLQKICGESEANIHSKQIAKRVRLSISDDYSRKHSKIKTKKNVLKRRKVNQ